MQGRGFAPSGIPPIRSRENGKTVEIFDIKLIVTKQDDHQDDGKAILQMNYLKIEC